MVSLDTWHAMIAFPSDASSSTSTACGVEEWGYAERAWYLEGRQGMTGVLRALFWRTDGVVEVGCHDRVWAARTPQPPADLFTFRVTKHGAANLHRHLVSTLASQK